MACDSAGNLYVGGAFTDLTDANGATTSPCGMGRHSLAWERGWMAQ
jgi:hypothetical protein